METKKITLPNIDSGASIAKKSVVASDDVMPKKWYCLSLSKNKTENKKKLVQIPIEAFTPTEDMPRKNTKSKTTYV